MTATPLITGATYRPTWSHFWAKAKGRLVLIPLAFLIGWNRMGMTVVPYLLVLLVVLAAGLWIYLRTTSITVSDTAVTRRGWGRTTIVEFDGSQRGILCTLNMGVQNLAYLAVRNGTGRRLVLTEANWPGEQLLEIAQHAGLTIMPADQVFSGKNAAAIVPGVVPLTTRRPVLCALVALAGLIAVIVPFAMVMAGAV
ncbi:MULTISPECIES: hypothetical protein [unclassified Frigoribacterium]|uniref:hypothetical protein n=1 Tax=unclassified Frigoribacterium TaxID=2627005 RepID=UPI0006F2FAAD|nr:MULTISPECIES: hypothetical protein [unclassified Frigoribacterium]KQO47971.1 hypothetical protein ASF07_11295 [Frigoribacterium sp. Leaf254]KQT40065.1 hypothetical protein ASG28_11305 [Frigoribacterium sp. Leaf415]